MNTMHKIIIYFLLFTWTGITWGQNEDADKYARFTYTGDSLYHAKQYKASAKHFQTAFDALGGKAYPNDRYNAACAYALAGNKKMAFFHLNNLAEGSVKYSNYNHIIQDTDLNTLHKDKRWMPLIQKIKENNDEIEKDYDRPLIKLLDSIYNEDQKYRHELPALEEKYGRNSPEVKAHWKIIEEKDSLNLIVVKKILNERGWLGPKIIGELGGSTLFLVIQHSDLETQKYYLPMMREAVKNKNANPSNLALLEDRVALGLGEKQIYGSQIGINNETGTYFVLPLANPDEVDQRRAEVGLAPLNDYVSMFGMTWNLEEYKQQLPELEKYWRKNWNK
jgi:hypothetical protein